MGAPRLGRPVYDPVFSYYYAAHSPQYLQKYKTQNLHVLPRFKQYKSKQTKQKVPHSASYWQSYGVKTLFLGQICPKVCGSQCGAPILKIHNSKTIKPVYKPFCKQKESTIGQLCSKFEPENLYTSQVISFEN